MFAAAQVRQGVIAWAGLPEPAQEGARLVTIVACSEGVFQGYCALAGVALACLRNLQTC